MGEICFIAQGEIDNKMSNLHLHFLLLGLGCLFTGLLSAQSSLIQGVVYDQINKSALPGSTIMMIGDPGIGTITDSLGRFSLESRNFVSTDSIEISFIGYQSKHISIKNCLKKGGCRINLEPAIQSFSTLEVKASRLTAEAFSVSKIGKLDIYTNPSAKADPLLAVQSLPASTSTDETANISLRGSSPAETTIFINNVPVRDVIRLDQNNGLGQFSIFNTSIIDQVNVFPSNPPLEYGNSTSGSVALFTENAIESNYNSVAVTLANVSAFSNRHFKSGADLTLYSNYNFDPLLKGLNPKSLERIKHFRSIDLGTHFVQRFKNKHRIKVFNYLLDEDYSYQIEEPTFNGAFNQKKRKWLNVLNYYIPIGKGIVSFNQGFHWSDSRYTLANFDNQVERRDYYGGLNWSFPAGNHLVKTGLSYSNWFNGIDAKVPLYFYALGDAYPTFEFEETEHLEVAEWFGYGKFNFHKGLNLGVGLRLHLPFESDQVQWSGQIQLQKEFGASQQIGLAAGQYRNWVMPSIEFERITSVLSHQLAIDYSWGIGAGTIKTAIYWKSNQWNQISNEIRGGELSFQLQKGIARGTVSFATVSSKLHSNAIHYPSAYDLNYFIRMNGRIDIPDILTISLVLNQRQGRYFIPLQDAVFDHSSNTYQPIYAPMDGGSRLPDYRLLDISINRLFTASNFGIVAFISANNVFNIKNVQGYSHNFDYTEERPVYFNRRVVFCGVVISM